MKPQVYRDERPASYFDRFHERTRTARPDWVYDLVRLILTPFLLLVYRTRAIDAEKVPARGAAIIAPNHFSFLDHFFVAVCLRRKVHFMGKSQLFRWPMRYVYSHGGVFPVRRGQRDEEAFRTARTVLERGDILVMYPEGGRSRGQQLGEPRPGLGRLALETGAPVVPTAIEGSAEVRHWTRLKLPKVTIRYGDPVRFERVEHPTHEQSQAAAEALFQRVEPLYASLRSEGRRGAVRAARAARGGPSRAGASSQSLVGSSRTASRGPRR